jgi:hypothetical protein
MRASALLLLLIARPVSAQRPGIDAVRWLAGCWEVNSGTRRIVERWSPPASGEMTGSSRTTVNGVPRESERLRLFLASDTLVYEALPSGQTLTHFKAKTVAERELVFENLAHDFPQRIIYRRTGPDSVIATIEGDRAGQRQPVSFPFKRAECIADTPTPAETARNALTPLYKDFSDRENADLAGTNAWFAAHAAESFQFVVWVVSGNTALTATRAQLASSVEIQRASPAFQALRERTHTLTLDRLSLRGDTIIALVSIRRTYKFPDAGGRYGAPGAVHERRTDQRRLDTWVREGGQLKLREAAIIGEDVRIDGKLTTVNGQPVPPG